MANVITDTNRLLPAHQTLLSPYWRIEEHEYCAHTHWMSFEGYYLLVDCLIDAIRQCNCTHDIVRAWDLLPDKDTGNAEDLWVFRSWAEETIQNELLPPYLQVSIQYPTGCPIYCLTVDHEWISNDAQDDHVILTGDSNLIDVYDNVIYVNDHGNTSYHSNGQEIWAFV